MNKPSNFNLFSLIRKNIINITPYISARSEHSIEEKKSIFLDANENSFGSTLEYKNYYNRYPDPFQNELKRKISNIKKIPSSNIFLGNGSDEIIDLIYRIFSIPKMDHSIIFPPTYGMFEIIGKINDVDLVKIPLTKNDYQLDVEKIKRVFNKNSKILFICSPNNPTGNDINRISIEKIINTFPGIVVIDEAYIDFSKEKSFIEKLDKFPNMIVLQTLSKSWGLAGIRIGICFASNLIINFMNKIKYPYNINIFSQKIAIEALDNKNIFFNNIKRILYEKKYMINALNKISIIEKIYPSSSNFIFVKILFSSKNLYQYLIRKKIFVRDRSNIFLCKNCLRITIGTHEENKYLIKFIKKYSLKF